MNKVYLVRHGESVVNVNREFSCLRVDKPLTAKGILQAEQTAEYAAALGIEELYASPMIRTRQTAEIIGARLGLPVTLVEAFREVQVGDLELKPGTREAWAYHNEVMRDWLTGRPERQFPGGENYFQLVGRMRAGLAEVLRGKDGRVVMIVGHGGIFTMSLPELVGRVDLAWLAANPNHNCSISELRFIWNGNRLEGELADWASCTHLSGDAAQVVPGVIPDGGPAGADR